MKLTGSQEAMIFLRSSYSAQMFAFCIPSGTTNIRRYSEVGCRKHNELYIVRHSMVANQLDNKRWRPGCGARCFACHPRIYFFGCKHCTSTGRHPVIRLLSNSSLYFVILPVDMDIKFRRHSYSISLKTIGIGQASNKVRLQIEKSIINSHQKAVFLAATSQPSGDWLFPMPYLHVD